MGIAHPVNEHFSNHGMARNGRPGAAEAPFQEAESTLALISCQRFGRFFASSTFLRRRMDFGVTSTNSSSEINSIAFSSVNSRGGISRIASSALDERLFACFL